MGRNPYEQAQSRDRARYGRGDGRRDRAGARRVDRSARHPLRGAQPEDVRRAGRSRPGRPDEGPVGGGEQPRLRRGRGSGDLGSAVRHAPDDPAGRRGADRGAVRECGRRRAGVPRRQPHRIGPVRVGRDRPEAAARPQAARLLAARGAVRAELRRRGGGSRRPDESVGRQRRPGVVVHREYHPRGEAHRGLAARAGHRDREGRRRARRGGQLRSHDQRQPGGIPGRGRGAVRRGLVPEEGGVPHRRRRRARVPGAVRQGPFRGIRHGGRRHQRQDPVPAQPHRRRLRRHRLRELPGRGERRQPGDQVLRTHRRVAFGLRGPDRTRRTARANDPREQREHVRQLLQLSRAGRPGPAAGEPDQPVQLRVREQLGSQQRRDRAPLVREGPGPGGDAVLGLVHAGALSGGAPTYTGRDNAYMLTLPDGLPAWSGMFLWEPVDDAFEGPYADGNFDASVIEHEYVHGLSNRYVSPEDGALGTHQSGSMGEGWSDWYALNHLDRTGLDTSSVVGKSVTGNTTRGIRNWSYDKDPTNYGDVGYDLTGAEVHADGSIWTEILWQLRKALVAKYGKADGSMIAAHIVTDGMP